MEYIKCILCDSDFFLNDYISVVDRFDENYRYQLQKCRCGLVMLNPRPGCNDIAEYYENINYLPHGRKKNVLGVIYKILQRVNNRFKSRIIENAFIGKKRVLLDFGSGDGQFSKYMSTKGWDSYSYDPFFRSSNQNELEGLQKSKKFNVITMFHSLEHIHDIDSTFLTINNVLDKKGLLVIAVPNHNAYERNILREKWIAYDAPRHLLHFNFETMRLLLDKYNFEIKFYKPIYLDTFHNIIMSHKNKILSSMRILIQISVSLVGIFWNNKRASSLIFVCKKK
ncbi:MAG: hypothetical protein CMG00_05025 [Candidatus Marinimicrobia bacterium]|nr:hypothetical protein [Candidatus Neomarinimicrobiota bacterium]